MDVKITLVPLGVGTEEAVSYTHLDVYKRQRSPGLNRAATALSGTVDAAEGVKPLCTPGIPSALRPAPSPRPAASPP